MILDIPQPTSPEVDFFSHTIAAIDVWTPTHSFTLVTLVIMFEDLADRPFIIAQAHWPDNNMYYQLVLITGPEREIRISSRHLGLLRFYLDGILTNTSITIEDTKSKFPELFL